MKRVPALVVMVLAAIVLAAGCSSAPTRFDFVPLDRVWLDAGTPLDSTALARDIRYYRDEQGQVWDDRGRNHGVMPLPL